MKTDASSLLRLGQLPANVFTVAIIASVLVFALPGIGAMKSPWFDLAALALFIVGAVIMSRPHPDPFPLRLALVVLGIDVVVTAVVDWDLPQTGYPGYNSWNFGAVNWLLFFLVFRGRPALGWVGFGLMAAITISWSAMTGRGVGEGANYVVFHAGTLLMGTLFGALLRRAAERLTALQQEQVAQAAGEAAALTELGEREVQAAQLNTEARAVLEQIASGDYLDPGDQRGFELLEASLRDTLRGGGLRSEEVVAAARAARLRGASVVLLDDRNDPLDPASSAVVESALLAELATLRKGAMTARLLPPGRDVIATIVRNDGQRRRIDIAAAADG